MIINGFTLLAKAPIRDMLTVQEKNHGVSHGLAQVGYDIRIKQRICFVPSCLGFGYVTVDEGEKFLHEDSNFALGSTIEEFQMPDDLVGIVHDKSTWARQGISVFNTVIEPGWKGFLTLELVFNGIKPVCIEAGSGIAQVIFHQILEKRAYDGKYQHQEDRPVPAIVA